MKSSDLWAFLILSMMPEKPLELEGMWRSCQSIGAAEGDLEYVAEFKEDELVENYYGTLPGMGNCNGRRIFHFRRKWQLSSNNFNFKTKYKNSDYLYVGDKNIPNWYGCYFERVQKGPQICDLRKMAGDQDLYFINNFSYRIRGETLETNLKGSVSYFKRVEYPNLFKIKQYLLGHYYSNNDNRP